MSGNSEILRVQSRRAARQRRVQIAQHVIAAIVLISVGVEHHPISVLSVAEIVAGALLIVSVIRAHLHRSQHGGIAWVELVGAGMTFVEAIEKTRGRHHLSFVVLTFIQPLVLLIFAIFDTQVASARYLKADGEGFEVRLRLLFRRRVRWDEVRGFRVTGNAIEVDVNGKQKKIKLRDVVDRDAAVAWSVDQFKRRGIVESRGAN